MFIGDVHVEYAIGIGIGLVFGLVVGYFITQSIMMSQVGGKTGLELGKRVAAKVKADPTFTPKLELLFNPPPVKPSGEPVRLLGVLQRDARLLDFLMEN